MDVIFDSVVRREAGSTDDSSSSMPTSKGAAVVALILYLIPTVWIWIAYFRTGRPKYMLSLALGSACLAIGYLIRATGSYAWQFFFIFLSPCALLANSYVVLSRLQRALGPDVARSCSPLPASLIVVTFVLSDVVTFCLQTAGTALLIIGGKFNTIGKVLVILGVILQLATFSLFTFLLVVFTRRLRRFCPSAYRRPSSPLAFLLSNALSLRPLGPEGVWAVVQALRLSCGAILVRSVYRAVEQADGFFGTIARHEVYLYIFDALPLLLDVVAFACVWPPRVIGAGWSALTETGEGVPLG